MLRPAKRAVVEMLLPPARNVTMRSRILLRDELTGATQITIVRLQSLGLGRAS